MVESDRIIAYDSFSRSDYGSTRGYKEKYLVSDLTFRFPYLTKVGRELRGIKQIHSVSTLKQDEFKDSLFYVYFLHDDIARAEVAEIIGNGGSFAPPPWFNKGRYVRVNSNASAAIRGTQKNLDRISHFSLDVHENICEALEATRRLNGVYIEIGVYKGGSALTALLYSRFSNLRNRKFYFLDTFDGFEYEEAYRSQDVTWGGELRLFGVANTRRFVHETLEQAEIPFKLITLNICNEDLPDELRHGIVVANVDVDMYEATEAALMKIAPLVVQGGIIICEDPASTPGLYGSLVAMENFLMTPEGIKFVKIFKRGQYFLIKVLH